MKFTVELEDFWMDEDSGGIEEELKNHIVTSVVVQIKKQIQESIDSKITEHVKEKADIIISAQIKGKVTELIETGEIKPRHKSESILITEYVKEKFMDNSGWGSTDSQVKDLAKKFSDEMKKRYDAAFACHIVDNMRKNGLLKEDEITKLLESTGNKS